MKKITVRFAPWVGSHYEEGLCGLRTLLVCESHYGDRKHERPTTTPEILKALALGEKHPLATKKLRQHPHFTKIMKAVKNIRQPSNHADTRDFWNRVAYYNFLQEFISDVRIRPSKDAWDRGKIAFSEVLDVLVPDLIVCLSMRNGSRVQSLTSEIPVAVVNHPSSRFTYSRVNPVIARHKEMALVRKAHVPTFTSSDVFVRWCEATASALPTPGSHLCESDKVTILAQRQQSMMMLDESMLP